MKKMLSVIAVSIFFSFPAQSQNAKEICMSWGDTAYEIMSSRQKGEDEKDVLTGTKEFDNYLSAKIYSQLVDVAFDQPLKENKKKISKAFSYFVYKDCLKTFDK